MTVLGTQVEVEQVVRLLFMQARSVLFQLLDTIQKCLLATWPEKISFIFVNTEEKISVLTRRNS